MHFYENNQKLRISTSCDRKKKILLAMQHVLLVMATRHTLLVSVPDYYHSHDNKIT